MSKTKDLSPNLDLLSAEEELQLPVSNDALGNRAGGLSLFSDSFKRGYGDSVFGSDSRGIWLGAADFDTAPFKVDMDGNLVSTSASITGMGQNFVSTLAWTATDRDTASWGSGIVKTNGGVTYSIVGGNTGNIVATTYVYLNPAVSTTVLQTSTDPANAAGSNILLLAIIEIGDVGSECIITVLGSSGTTIDGGKIVTGSIEADSLNVTNLAAISANLGTITAGSLSGISIAIGSGDSIFKADSNGIYLGNATFASAPFRVAMNGAVVASSITLTNASIGSGSSYAGNVIDSAYIGNLSADKITTGTLNASNVSVINLSASNLKTGTLIVGNTSNAVSEIKIYRNGDTGYLYWDDGSKIWTDGNGYMGYDSKGARHYFNNNGGNMLILQYSVSRLNTGLDIYGGLYIDGDARTHGKHTVEGELHTNAIIMDASGSEANIDKINILKGSNDLNFQLGSSSSSYWFSWYDDGYNEKMYLKRNGDWHVVGSKSSDVAVDNGKMVSLFAVEAPEVWFMDFCKDKKNIDPLFLQTVEGDLHFLKCEGGEYLVFGHRKGYSTQRLPEVHSADHEAKAEFNKQLDIAFKSRLDKKEVNEFIKTYQKSIEVN